MITYHNIPINSQTGEGPAERWENDYRKGQWDYLRNREEQARFDILAAFVHRFGVGRVLDVGAGIGQLLPRLDPRFVTDYTAMDVSGHALAQLPPCTIPASRLTMDITAHALPSDEQYDAIVISEVLYYLDDPIGILNRLSNNLSETGCVIVSMGRPPPGREQWIPVIEGIWQALDRSDWLFQDEVLLTDVPSELTWRVRVLRPASEHVKR